MHPFWYDVLVTENKVTCIKCNNLRFNMFTGHFYCSENKSPIPTKNPEDEHICKSFKLIADQK